MRCNVSEQTMSLPKVSKGDDLRTWETFGCVVMQQEVCTTSVQHQLFARQNPTHDSIEIRLHLPESVTSTKHSPTRSKVINHLIHCEGDVDQAREEDVDWCCQRILSEIRWGSWFGHRPISHFAWTYRRFISRVETFSTKFEMKLARLVKDLDIVHRSKTTHLAQTARPPHHRDSDTAHASEREINRFHEGLHHIWA